MMQQLIVIFQVLIPTSQQSDLTVQVLYLIALLAHQALDQAHPSSITAAESLLFMGGLRRIFEVLLSPLLHHHINLIIY